MTKSVEEEILKYIDEFDPVESKDLLETVFEKLRKILQDPEEVENWIIGQMDIYLNEGKAGINGFLADGKAALKQLGFDSNQVDNWLTPIVDGLEHREHVVNHLKKVIVGAGKLGVGVVSTFIGRTWDTSISGREWQKDIDYNFE